MKVRGKTAADAALRAMHTFPVERRLDPAEFMTLQTEGSLTFGRDSFETDEEWRAFIQSLGLGNAPAGFRISLSPAGGERLTDDSDAEGADPMDPPPPWLAQGEEWLRWYADMRRNPSRFMP
ncbi:hypothetical protein ACIQW5_26025 [Methylorubrum thiocyanatum]|uniref:hypothetical protein n=1 Tax=Methylorubrum thiocyanatum TaxID=47958 RepID=UPI00383A9221